jgi:hypothetical protein
MQGAEDARTTSSRPRRRLGRRAKLAALLALIAPGLLTEALTARAGISSLSPQDVTIGRSHELEVHGKAYVRCRDSGCGGSTQHPIDVERLQLDVKLSFTPDAANQSYTLDVTANDGFKFIPPLTGSITLVDAKLSERTKSDIRNQARGRCDELEILENITINKFSVKR